LVLDNDSRGSAGKCLVIFILRLFDNLEKAIFWFFWNKIDEYWLLFGYFVILVYPCDAGFHMPAVRA